MSNFEKFLKTSSPEIQELTVAISSAGEAIKALTPRFQAKKGEGPRSGVTVGDGLSHKMLVTHLMQAFPDALILSEEGKVDDHPNLLSVNNPVGLVEAPLAFIIDPLDGTAPYGSSLGTWCVAGAVMTEGVIVGSVVYAPAINGGMLVLASHARGVQLVEWGEERAIQPLTAPTPPSSCMVGMGVDSTLYEAFTSLVPQIGANIRGWALCNSGILGLAQVACGRLQAVVQTPQKVWDWAPAYRAVLESGRKFNFFRLVPDEEVGGQTDRLVSVEVLDESAFCAQPVSNRLGFVAGEPELADRIFRLLPSRGWARKSPDTITGTWG